MVKKEIEVAGRESEGKDIDSPPSLPDNILDLYNMENENVDYAMLEFI